ncbi:dynein heavy chain axonemal-like protein, partial [Lasius niger]
MAALVLVTETLKRSNVHAASEISLQTRFNEIKEFYNEDMTFDESIIRDNKQCDLFRNWCIRYKREIDTIDRVVEHQPLGIFLVQLERFKNAALNAPRSKKKVIEAVMPG